LLIASAEKKITTEKGREKKAVRKRREIRQ
jgi:hypothetical protein